MGYIITMGILLTIIAIYKTCRKAKKTIKDVNVNRRSDKTNTNIGKRREVDYNTYYVCDSGICNSSNSTSCDD